MTSEPVKVVIVGSINMDLVTRVSRIPAPGETIAGHSFQEIPGGKGANQAVAAARLGATCHLIGRVGDDAFGQTLLRSLQENGVQTEAVQVTPQCPSGIALINVEDSGENCITIIAGANGWMTPADVQQYAQLIATADVLLLQLEIPLPAVETAVAIARQHEVLTLLNPAPACSLPESLWQVDVLTPNLTEGLLLLGPHRDHIEDAHQLARELQERGPALVALTLGELGSICCTGPEESDQLFPPKVQAVDTTAAGDAFSGALGVALAEGWNRPAAVAFANCAGALAITIPGAQPALPAREQVLQLFQQTYPSL